MLKDQEGMAFIAVIMAVLIFSSLCATILILAEQENLVVHDIESSLEALYAAEGGIRILFEGIKDNPAMTFEDIEEMCGNLTNLKPAIGEGIIESVSAKEVGENIEITVSAASENAIKVLVAHISMPSQSELRLLLNGLTTGSGGLTVNSGEVIEGDIFSGGPVNLQAASTVVGSIRALGNVTVASTVVVQGDVFSCGTIAVAENATVTGIVQPNLISIPEVPRFPELNLNFLKRQAAEEGNFFAGSQDPRTFNSADLSQLSGVYFCEGNVLIDSNATPYSGTGVIAATGNIVISNDILPDDANSSIALISCGDITIINGGAIEGVVLAGGRLECDSEGKITGIASAGNICDFRGDFLYSDNCLSGLLEEYLALDGTPAELQIWREEYDVY